MAEILTIAGREVKKLEVVVSDFGSYVGKTSERLVVKRQGKVVLQVPFHDLERVVIEGRGISISTDAVYKCMEAGIHIDFLTLSGEPIAKLSSPALGGTVLTRREQLLAMHDERGLHIARTIVEAKLRNQLNTMKYFAKSRKTAASEFYTLVREYSGLVDQLRSELAALEASNIDSVRTTMMNIEARGSRRYWELLAKLLEGRVNFPGREHRGATDETNMLLNYGYGVLYSRVWGAVLRAGLEPFAGYLHTDRPGKPSLVLDLTEEFRQPVVDRVVLAALIRGFTVKRDESGFLHPDTRRELVRRIGERLESRSLYDGRRFKLGTIIQRQARRLAAYLRGEAAYRPFICGW